MADSLHKKSLCRYEILSQVGYHILVFIALTVTRRDPTIEVSEVVVFLNYTTTALFMSYWALPRYNNNKKGRQAVMAPKHLENDTMKPTEQPPVS